MSKPPTAAAAYRLREAKALHEVGVQNHGWYMTEAEHRGVLDVLERLEAALRGMIEAAESPGQNRLFLAIRAARDVLDD